MKKLEKAQKYILTHMHRKALTFSSKELFNVFGVMDVHQLHILQVLKKMHLKLKSNNRIITMKLGIIKNIKNLET